MQLLVDRGEVKIGMSNISLPFLSLYVKIGSNATCMCKPKRFIANCRIIKKE